MRSEFLIEEMFQEITNIHYKIISVQPSVDHRHKKKHVGLKT